MSVIMRLGRRRCDARCYHAWGDKCTCICGGRNHGKMEQGAIENTREMVKDAPSEMKFSIDVLYTQPSLVPNPEPEVI